MTVEMSKSTGTWTVGWNRPGWSAPVPNTIGYANFAEAWDGYVGILGGEGGRQLLDEFQRHMLTELLLHMSPVNGTISQDTEAVGGRADMAGKLIFWIAKL